MAASPTNVQVRADLTNYAYGLTQDANEAMRVANILAPVVPTGGSNGQFNKFDDTQAFKAYAAAVARRAVGGQANVIGFLSDPADYSAKPNGLRISIDEHERIQAANNMPLLEQAKTRTLIINCAVSHLAAVITKVDASVTATSGKGAWNNANVDPIEEIDGQIKAIYLATGMVATNVMFDFGAWLVMKSNPNMLKRMPGADVTAVTPQRVQAMLGAPNARVDVVNTAKLTGGGLGNSSATKVGILGGKVYIFVSSGMPDAYDPSFMKVFAPSAQLFTGIRTWREEPHLDWYESDWTTDVQVVSSGLCKSISVTNATSN